MNKITKMRQLVEEVLHQSFLGLVPILMLFVSLIFVSEVAKMIVTKVGLPNHSVISAGITFILAAGFVGISITAANGMVRYIAEWLIWRDTGDNKPNGSGLLVNTTFFVVYVCAVIAILWALELDRATTVAILSFEILNVGAATVVGYNNVRQETELRVTYEQMQMAVAEMAQQLVNRKELESVIKRLTEVRAGLETKQMSLESDIEDLEIELQHRQEAQQVLEKLNRQIENENDDLKAQRLNLEKKVRQLNTHVATLHSEKEKLEDDITSPVKMRQFAVKHMVKREMSMEEIANIFEVSERTIRNDVKEIENGKK